MALKFLTSEQKQFWQENGYIKLSNVYSMKEMNEISDAYNELFERKHRENLAGLESSWVGEDMKKLAGYTDYTVSIKKHLLQAFCILQNSYYIFIYVSGKIYSQSANAQ